MQSTSCEMPGWMKHKPQSRLQREISITSDMQMTPLPPYGRKQRGTKEPLDESERGEWKSCLKTQHSKNEDHSIQSHHFMANSWGSNGNSDRLYFLSCKITADRDCSYEIKGCLLLGRKAMTNLDSVLKSKDITNKNPSSQSYSFAISHVWMWELDHKKTWVIKNWLFWTVMLEKTLESPLNSKKIKSVNQGNQPWILIRRTDADWSSNTLATSWEELIHWKRPWCWKRLKAGGEGDDRGWDSWMASLTRWTWVWASSGSWWWTGKPGELQSMGCQRVRHNWGTELNWTEL